MIPLIDLKAQFELIHEEIYEAVSSVLESGRYIMGDNVSRLENAIAAYTGTKYAISCANGTDALILALTACGIGHGDEVLTTPFTFFATAEAISRTGAIPIFSDVDPDTYNLDAGLLEAKITNRTKAILPVHLFGQPAYMDAISTIARKYGLYVIEDACQAAGAAYNGKAAGALGDIACFSFFPTKNLGAYGDGGIITTDSEQLAIIIKSLRVHGSGDAGRAAYELLYPCAGSTQLEADITSLDLCGRIQMQEHNETVEIYINARDNLITTEKEHTNMDDEDLTVYDKSKYYNYLIGYNSRLDELQAAILLTKLKHLDDWNNRRNEIADYYSKILLGSSIIPPKVTEGVKSVYHMYVVQSENRMDLADYLHENGISTGVYYPVPLHLQKAYQSFGYKKGDFPVSEYLSKRTLAIPIYPELTLSQQEYIADTLLNFKPRHL